MAAARQAAEMAQEAVKMWNEVEEKGEKNMEEEIGDHKVAGLDVGLRSWIVFAGKPRTKSSRP